MLTVLPETLLHNLPLDSRHQLAASLFAHTTDAALLLNNRLELKSWNPAAARLLQLDAGSLNQPLANLRVAGHAISGLPHTYAAPFGPGTCTLFTAGCATNFQYQLLPLGSTAGAGDGLLLLLQPAIAIAPPRATSAATEAQQQLSFNNAEQGTWDWDIASGKVAYNEYYATMRGQDIAGMNTDVSGFWESLYPADREVLEQALELYFEGGTPYYEAEFRVRTKAGNYIWVQGRGKVYQRDRQGKPLKMAGVEMDITRRKEAELALRASQNRLEATISAIPDCLKLLDTEARIVEINPAGLALAEADNINQVLGQTMHTFLHPQYHAAFDAMHQAALRGQAGQLEYDITGLKGTHRWMHDYCVPFYDANDQIIGALHLTRDITTRKLALDKVKKLNNELEQLNHYLQEKQDGERRRIALDIHEEIGQILSAQKLNISRARRGKDSTATDQLLAESSSQADTIMQIIRKLSGELHPVLLRDLGLNAAIEKLCSDFKKQSKLPIHFWAPATLPLISEDKQLAVYRCCEMALAQFSQEGSLQQIVIRLRHRGQQLLLQVAGLGGAMPPVSTSSSTLLANREKLRKLEGRLEIWNSPQRGSLLRMELPV